VNSEDALRALPAPCVARALLAVMERGFGSQSGPDSACGRMARDGNGSEAISHFVALFLLKSC
jgi:hypothetical protein